MLLLLYCPWGADREWQFLTECAVFCTDIIAELHDYLWACLHHDILQYQVLLLTVKCSGPVLFPQEYWLFMSRTVRFEICRMVNWKVILNVVTNFFFTGFAPNIRYKRHRKLDETFRQNWMWEPKPTSVWLCWKHQTGWAWVCKSKEKDLGSFNKYISTVVNKYILLSYSKYN